MNTSDNTATIQYVYRNKSNPLDIISEDMFEDMLNRGDIQVDDYTRVKADTNQQSENDTYYIMTARDFYRSMGTKGENPLSEKEIKNARKTYSYRVDPVSRYNITVLDNYTQLLQEAKKKAAAAPRNHSDETTKYVVDFPEVFKDEDGKLEIRFKPKLTPSESSLEDIHPEFYLSAAGRFAAISPQKYVGLAKSAFSTAKNFISTKLNPGWWADLTTIGAKNFVEKTASTLGGKYGSNMLKSGLGYLTGETATSGLTGGFSGFGATTIPGMFTNAYLGTKIGYEAFKDLKDNPNKTWKNYFWDSLGLMGGIATGTELGMKTIPEIYNGILKLPTTIRREYIKTGRQIRAKSIVENYAKRLEERINKIEKDYDEYEKRLCKTNEALKDQLVKKREELNNKLKLLENDPESIQEVKDFKRKQIQRFHSKNPNLDIEEYKVTGLNSDVSDFINKLKTELKHNTYLLDKLIEHIEFNGLSNPLLSGLKVSRAGAIDLQKASYEDIQNYARKHYLDIDGLFEQGPNGELIINKIQSNSAKIKTTFNSGNGEIPIFGETVNNLVKTGKFEIELVAEPNTHNGRVVISPKSQASSLFDEIKLKPSYTISEKAHISPGYDEIHKHNIKYIEEKLGAKIFGSSSIEGIPHSKHDYDVIMTDKQAARSIPGYDNSKLDKRGRIVVDLGELEGKGKGYYKTKTNKGYKNFGEIDVNIIQTGPDGKAKGYIAEEIFRQFFPEEYSKAAMEASLRGGSEIKISKTPQELLEAYDANVKTIMDCLEMGGKSTDNYKHALRIFGYINYADPKVVAEAIQRVGKMTDGTYKKAPNFDFTDVKTNKKLLKRMGVPYIDFAYDPQKMQNMFDYYCLNRTTVYRGINGIYSNYTELNKTFEEWPKLGGSAFGFGTNNVGGGSSGFGPFIRLRQLPVNYEGVSSPEEVLNRVDRVTGTNLKLTAKEAQFLNNAVGKYIKVPFHEGSTTNDLLHATPTQKGWEALSRALEKLGIYALSGNNYGNGVYMSVINNIPISGPNGKPLSIPHYFNRPLENMNSIDSRLRRLDKNLLIKLEPYEFNIDSSPTGSRLVWNGTYLEPLKKEDIPEIPFFEIHERIRRYPHKGVRHNEDWIKYNESLAKWVGRTNDEYFFETPTTSKLDQINRNIKNIKIGTGILTGAGLTGAAVGSAVWKTRNNNARLTSYVSYQQDLDKIDAERIELYRKHKNNKISTDEFEREMNALKQDRKECCRRIRIFPTHYISPLSWTK